MGRIPGLRNLTPRVVGEGVETLDVLTALRSGGCDVAQGFFLARPMPVEHLPEWLSQLGHGDPELDMAPSGV